MSPGHRHGEHGQRAEESHGHHDHVGHGHGDHAGHGHHDHSHHVQMYSRLFWIMLALGIPTVAFSPMFAHLLGYEVTGWGLWVAPILGTVMYLWGGKPFLEGGRDEIRARQPGMMLLISLGITVAFPSVAAATIARTCSLSVTSVRTNSACTPHSSRSQAAVSVPAVSSTSATRTDAPSRARAPEIPRPMPIPAPVTTATRPSSVPMRTP